MEDEYTYGINIKMNDEKSIPLNDRRQGRERAVESARLSGEAQRYVTIKFLSPRCQRCPQRSTTFTPATAVNCFDETGDHRSAVKQKLVLAMPRRPDVRTRCADAAAEVLTSVGGLPTDRGLLWLALEHVWYALYCLLLPFSTTLSRRCLARSLRLDPPLYGLHIQERIETAAIAGGHEVMRGNLWLPAGQQGPFPVVLIRTPYGQNRFMEIGNGVLAERGYACLVQDTRGRFGSDGEFVPVEHERGDGAATVEWIRAQPWCDGRVAVFGASYLGFTAWACCGATKPGALQCAIFAITQPRVHAAVYPPGGGFSLELLGLWVYLVLKILSQQVWHGRCIRDHNGSCDDW